MMNVRTLALLLLTLAISSALAHADSQVEQLRAVWFAWSPCTAFRSWARTYPNATVLVDCVQIVDWHSTIWYDFDKGENGQYDIVILDSQWIGEGTPLSKTEDSLFEIRFSLTQISFFFLLASCHWR